MICDCGDQMIWDGERWECLECGNMIYVDDLEIGEDSYDGVLYG